MCDGQVFSPLMGSYFRLRVHTAQLLAYVSCVHSQGNFYLMSILTWWTCRTLDLDCLDLHLDLLLLSC